MYNSQFMIERIKDAAKKKGIGILKLQESCGLSRNVLSQAEKSAGGLTSKNLYTIADFLGCSTDYLLGLSKNQHDEMCISQSNNNIAQNFNDVAVPLMLTVPVSSQSEQQQEISNILSDLSPRERNKLMSIIYDYYDECKKENE